MSHLLEIELMKSGKQSIERTSTDATWPGKWIMKIGTWDVRSITRKEKELVDEFERSKFKTKLVTTKFT